MTSSNSFNNSSGNNSFGLMFIIALALHAAVLMIPTGEHSKTPESSKEKDKKTQVEPSPTSQTNSPKSLGESGKEDAKKTETESETKKTEVEPDAKKSDSASDLKKTEVEPDAKKSDPASDSQKSETESETKKTEVESDSESQATVPESTRDNNNSNPSANGNNEVPADNTSSDTNSEIP